MSPIRLCLVLLHPVQYYGAWFQWITTHCPEIELQVIYASAPTPAQQGAGFGREFEWDVPITEGYAFQIVRPARSTDRFDTGHFWGVDVKDVGPAIRDAHPDVVVVFGWYSITLVRAIRAARRLKIPVVYYGDTNLLSGPSGWRRPLWVVKTRWLLSAFSAYLSVGTRSAAFLRCFGVPDGRIFDTPHVVDNERFGQAVPLRQFRSEIRGAIGLPAEAFVVLFAGKLDPIKRPVDLVEAMGRMNPRPHLVVAGSGALETEVRLAAQRLGVGVSLLGFVNQADMVRVYAAADCLALPSASETWGLVVNEALAAGLPCVVSDQVGCAPDLVDGEVGAVFPTGDHAQLVPALQAAISGVRDRLRAGHGFAEACRARAATHSFARASGGLVDACYAVRSAGVTPGTTRPRSAASRAPRVIACCGSMVLLGGLERMTFEVLRVLRSRGSAVHCVVNWWDNIQIVRAAEQIGASWSTGFYTYRFARRSLTPRQIARFAWDTIRTSGGLLSDAWSFRPSHIFVSDYVTAVRNGPALCLLRLCGRRVVLRLGNAPDQGRFFRAVWRLGVNPCIDLFVCNSRFTESALAAHGIPQRKRITIPHTVPTRPVVANGVAKDRRRVIFVGQVIPEKGVDLLLDAAGQLVRQGRDLNLDIVGQMDGWAPPEHQRYRDALRARADVPDLRGRVRFLGFRDDVPKLLAASAIHCCPSRVVIREGFGIVVIEAKQAGIPSVVTPSGALTELVSHREDGWICADESAAAIAEGLEYFLDPSHLEGGMAAARQSAAAFGRERFEYAWSRVFSESQ